jgi:glycosyltransferase involved in cell wall biosynthesis
VRVLAPGPAAVTNPEPRLVVERLGGEQAFGWPGVLARLRERPSRALQVAAFLARVRRRLHACPAELVVAHWFWPCGLLALEQARASELWAHGSDVRLMLRRPQLLAAFASLAVRRPARLVFVAEHLRAAFLRALTPALRARLEPQTAVEAPPIELPDSGGHPALVSELPKGPFIAWVGRLIASKDPELALRVARGAGLPLVVVGDGPLSLPAQAGVLQLGLRPRGQALEVIRRSRLLLSTSREEGLSTVIREALAAERPVVALRCPSLPYHPLVHACESEREMITTVQIIAQQTG